LATSGEMIYRLIEFWQYKLFSENLISEKQLSVYLNSLCEIAELEFLSRLPRRGTAKSIISFIAKIGIQYGVNYDAEYLAKRWKKIFVDSRYISLAEATGIISKRDKNRCQYCPRMDNLQIHHVIPKDRKKYCGADSYYNLTLACKKCNIEISNTIVLPQNWWELHPESKFAP
jgi:hypothetical protein